MSILIKGMEMPEKCEDCRLSYTDQYGVTICAARDDCAYSVSCPLVPLPGKHGRLIDADALMSVLDILEGKGGSSPIWEQMRDIVENMVTIVPEEGGTGK